MKLFIKYMVSERCKMAVCERLNALGVQYGLVELGAVEVCDGVSSDQRLCLKAELLRCGLELMEDKKAVLIEKVKNVIIQMIHYADELPRTKNSDYISEQVCYDYTYLANLFSESTGTTIENFIIAHKIERAKELLMYNELNLTEISYRLNYSSVAHLSGQFKKVTGLTPSYFKKLRQKRSALENVGII